MIEWPTERITWMYEQAAMVEEERMKRLAELGGVLTGVKIEFKDKGAASKSSTVSIAELRGIPGLSVVHGDTHG